MATRPRSGDAVITKASLQTIRERLKEEAIDSEVCMIAGDVIDAANAQLTQITYCLGKTERHGIWKAYAHDQYTKYITKYYIPTPDEVLDRLRAKFPDSVVMDYQKGDMTYVTIDWS